MLGSPSGLIPVYAGQLSQWMSPGPVLAPLIDRAVASPVVPTALGEAWARQTTHPFRPPAPAMGAMVPLDDVILLRYNDEASAESGSRTAAAAGAGAPDLNRSAGPRQDEPPRPKPKPKPKRMEEDTPRSERMGLRSSAGANVAAAARPESKKPRSAARRLNL